MENDEDLAAVRAVVTGNSAAFAEIVERWQGPLFNLAYRFCRDRSQAADMAQDAFLKIFRALPSFREQSTFSTWMMSVAMNVFRSHQRRKNIRCPAWSKVSRRPQRREWATLRARAHEIFTGRSRNCCARARYGKPYTSSTLPGCPLMRP